MWNHLEEWAQEGIARMENNCPAGMKLLEAR